MHIFNFLFVCLIFTFTVSKPSGYTVKVKGVHIDQASMYSWFSTLLMFVLWLHPRPWRRQRMPSWRKFSVSRGINLIVQKPLFVKQYILHTALPGLTSCLYWHFICRFHQKQLLEETLGGCPSPPRPTRLDVETHSSPHGVPQGEAREMNKNPAPATIPSAQETGRRLFA